MYQVFCIFHRWQGKRVPGKVHLTVKKRCCHRSRSSQSQMHSGERKGVPNQAAWTEKSVWRVMFSSLLHSDELLLPPGPWRAACLDTICQVCAFLLFCIKFLLSLCCYWVGKREHQISGACVFLLCLLMQVSFLFFLFCHLLLSSIEWVQRMSTQDAAPWRNCQDMRGVLFCFIFLNKCSPLCHSQLGNKQ